MKGKSHFPSPASQQGVVLLESLIAILIFSLGVLGIVGLQATMIKNTSDAKFRSEASYIAQQRIGQMWSDPANVADYIEDAADISALLPSGLRTVAQPVAGGPFVVTVGWTAPGETPATDEAAPCFMLVAHCFTTTASIVGG